MSKPLIIAVVLVIILVSILIGYRYGGVGPTLQLRSRQQHFLTISQELKGVIKTNVSLKYVAVHLGKPPTDVIVTGFVTNSNDVRRLHEIVKSYRDKAEISVNVTIDPNIER
jgi:hypothetical protein